MKIRCPLCRREFEFDSAAGPARCPYEGCGWIFGTVELRQRPGEEAPVMPVQTSSDGLSLVDRFRHDLPAVPPTGSVPQRDSPARQCPACGKVTRGRSVFCPACGHSFEELLPEGEGLRAAFDISGSVIFTPRLITVLVVAALAALLAFTWMVSGRAGGGSGAGLTALESTPAAGTTLQGAAFVDMKREFLDPASTDFRRDVAREKYLGQRVIWSGLVKSVNSTGSVHQVDVVMEGPESRSFVTLEVLDLPDNRRLLGELVRGSRFLFSGRISGFDNGGPNDSFDYFRVVLKEGIILQ